MNTTTLGKNPYIVADLTSMVDNPVSAYYTIASGSKTRTGVEGSETVGVNSTPNPLDDVDMGSNRIYGFTGINAQFLPETKQIRLTFELSASSMHDYFHIDEGQVQVVLFNDNDITLFEKYHILDPYGFVSILSASKDQIRRVVRGIENSPDDGRGWGVYYSIPETSSDISTQICAYCYYAMDGKKAGFMDELELSDYRDLSDVYVFQGEDRLAFKYSEENIFGFGSQNYYFPVLNRQYPKTWAKSISEKSERNLVRIEENQLGFDPDNTYVLTMEDPAGIANLLGDVVIETQRDDSGTVMVYEDFLEYDESAGMNNYQMYSATDARNAPWVQYSETGMEQHLSSWQDELSASRTMEDVANFLLDHAGESQILGHESGNAAGTAEGREFTLLSGNCDLDGALDMYFTYRTTDSGIEIYVNYQNYLETPYSELRDGLEYPVMKDRTYLKLAPGENGDLDCMIQLRYTYGGNVRGIRDVILATYRIYNVSDDKPKVVVCRVSTLRKDSLTDIEVGNRMKISAQGIRIDTARILRGDTDVPATIFIQTPKKLQVPYEIGLFYPEDMLSCAASEENYQYRIDASVPGYVRIFVETGDNVQVGIPFRTVEGIDLGNRTVRYMSFSEDPVFGHDGVRMGIDYSEGKIQIVNPAYPVLIGNEVSSDLSVYLSQFSVTGDLSSGTFLNPT